MQVSRILHQGRFWKSARRLLACATLLQRGDLAGWQGIAQVREDHVAVSFGDPAGLHGPRIAEQVRVLSEERKGAIVVVLPERVLESEGGLLDGTVLAAGRAGVTIAGVNALHRVEHRDALA